MSFFLILFSCKNKELNLNTVSGKLLNCPQILYNVTSRGSILFNYRT
jgi:hypothetical protein